MTLPKAEWRLVVVVMVTEALTTVTETMDHSARAMAIVKVMATVHVALVSTLPTVLMAETERRTTAEDMAVREVTDSVRSTASLAASDTRIQTALRSVTSTQHTYTTSVAIAREDIIKADMLAKKGMKVLLSDVRNVADTTVREATDSVLTATAKADSTSARATMTLTQNTA